MIERQSPRNQTLYADLLQEVIAAQVLGGRGISFTRKAIKGHRYWYLSLAIGRDRLQAYLGPDTQEMSQQIETTKEKWRKARPSAAERRKLVAYLVSSGATATTPAIGSLLAILADGGVFRAGAVLVGSAAFGAYANMFGVRWPRGAFLTQDVDVAADRKIGVAISDEGARLADILDAAGGFAAVPGLLWREPSTRFTGHNISLDLLAPMRGQTGGSPVFVKRLGAYAEPLRFLDFLIADAQPAVLLAKDGVAVNIPAPARFALHKLVVAERRDAAWATKMRKDITQAALVIEVLLEDMPGSLAAAWDAARDYHGNFYRTALAAADRLPDSLRGCEFFSPKRV